MFDWALYLIALSLAIDCFVVSICLGGTNKISLKNWINIPFHFGLFQGGMALIGFYLGVSFLGFIESFDHWVAFGLLFLVGGKMIYEAIREKCEVVQKISYSRVILLSVATSIDALAIGIAFSIIDGGIGIKALVIGIFSLVLSFVGLKIGNKLKSFKSNYLEFIGGIVLIGIGVKILLEHL